MSHAPLNKICVIFNPSARGDKARRRKQFLDTIAGECALMPTRAPGAAEDLAENAIRLGFNTLVAAGGDGTLNEVLNGMGRVPDGFERARVGVLPMGTVNVFAREMGIPLHLRKAWRIIRDGHEVSLDLPLLETGEGASRQTRHFIQMLGIGWDARAVLGVDWVLKKRWGALAYAWSAWQAWKAQAEPVTVRTATGCWTGEQVLLSTGRFYGGSIVFFPKASQQDGQIDGLVLPSLSLGSLLKFSLATLFRQHHWSGAHYFQSDRIELPGPSGIPMEMDGDPAGQLPATCTLSSSRLRAVVPAAKISELTSRTAVNPLSHPEKNLQASGK